MFRHLKHGLEIVGNIAVVLVAALIIKQQLLPTSAVGAAPVEEVSDAHLDLSQLNKKIGNSKLVLVEFGDFECPFCSRHATETFPQLKKDFIDRGKLSYVFMHFPLEQIHKDALGASKAAECAADQNSFWEMHDRLYANPARLSRDDLTRHAQALNLDERAFADCLENGSGAAVQRDVDAGMALQVQSTPAFFVGVIGQDGQVDLVRKITGAVPYSVFAETLEEYESKDESSGWSSWLSLSFLTKRSS